MNKSIHDIFTAGSKVLINGRQCIANGIMLLGSKKQMYSILNITLDDGEESVLGVDLQTNVLFSPPQEQMYMYLESVKLHNKRLAHGDNVQVLKYKDNSFVPDYTKAIEKIIAQQYGNQCYAKLSVGEKDYSIVWYSLLRNKQGDSLIVSISENEMMSGLATYPLYNDVVFSISFSDFDLKYSGNIVRIEKTNSSYLLYIHGYPVEVLQSTQGNRTVFKNIANPFSVMDFIINHADSGIAEVIYPYSNEKPVQRYIIVGVLENIEIDIEGCAIGNVRIGTQIDTSQEFINAISNMAACSEVWVSVDADSLYNAFSEGKRLLEVAAEFLTFLMKNDMYSEWYGTLSSENKMWDIRSHYPQISLGKVFYVENCIIGESITFTDENIRTPSVVKMDDASEYLFDCDWIEGFFRRLQSKDKKIMRLRYAIKWIAEAWGSDDAYDKVIYCSMALEFIVNGEKGSNIFDEYAQKFSLQKITKKRRQELISGVYEKAKIESIEGFSEENLADLNESVRKMIQSKLNESSFGTKLDSLINRLTIPISEDEKELLKKARSIRNELIHGLDMSAISTLEIKKLCGITSRVLIYKLIDALNKE